MRIRAWLIIAYAVALLILAFTPPLPFRLQPEGTSLKLHHVAAFAVLTVVTWLGFQPSLRSRSRSVPAAAAAAFLLGVLIECVQVFLPYRSGQVRDLASNALGIAAGAAFAWLLQRARRR